MEAECDTALQGKVATVMRRTVKSKGASKGAASKGGAAPTDITYYGPGTERLPNLQLTHTIRSQP